MKAGIVFFYEVTFIYSKIALWMDIFVLIFFPNNIFYFIFLSVYNFSCAYSMVTKTATT